MQISNYLYLFKVVHAQCLCQTTDFESFSVPFFPVFQPFYAKSLTVLSKVAKIGPLYTHIEFIFNTFLYYAQHYLQNGQL